MKTLKQIHEIIINFLVGCFYTFATIVVLYVISETIGLITFSLVLFVIGLAGCMIYGAFTGGN